MNYKWEKGNNEDPPLLSPSEQNQNTTVSTGVVIHKHSSLMSIEMHDGNSRKGIRKTKPMESLFTKFVKDMDFWALLVQALNFFILSFDFFPYF